MNICGLLPCLRAAGIVVLTLAGTAAAAADLPQGSRQIVLHARDGSRIDLGQVVFTPQADGRTAFRIQLGFPGLEDHFLSMREFKCVAGQGEKLCVVPYPYPQPGTIGRADLAWLEHSLIFLRNRPGDHGARLSEGVYFALTPTAAGGFDGRLQAVDLTAMGVPPPDAKPPLKATLRDDVPVGARWFQRLTIE